MEQVAVEMRRQYKREWYKKNKDKVKAANERYWNKKAAEAEEKQKIEKAS